MAGHCGVSNIRVALVNEDTASPAWDSSFDATVTIQKAGPSAVVQITNAQGGLVLQTALSPKMVWRASPALFFLNASPQHAGSKSYALKCPSQQVADTLQQAMDNAVQAAGPGPSSLAAAGASGNTFDRKTDKGSAEMYFHYYGMIMHQQNMLQDYTRTGMYYMAITENRPDFEGKVVMDVGAGSGILSLFSAQAGARKVYAVEASGMAKFARQLADSNPALGSRIEVVHGKVEEVKVPEKVDVLVSEPMGTLLVNERMLETYLYARDHFLKPGGKMFPQIGRIHVAAFSDPGLYQEVNSKAAFWMQNSFYGVDVTSLYCDAMDSYFAQVVVDAFDPSVLVSTCNTKIFDFATIPESELHDIQIPLQLQILVPGRCTINGLACWFDVLFNGSRAPVWLSTAPGLPTTHWFQLRCLLKQPLYVTGPGCTLTGMLHLRAHERQSYDVVVTLQGPPLQPGQPPQQVSGIFDLKEPYYRQLSSGWLPTQQQQAGVQPAEQQHAGPGGMAGGSNGPLSGAMPDHHMGGFAQHR